MNPSVAGCVRAAESTDGRERPGDGGETPFLRTMTHRAPYGLPEVTRSPLVSRILCRPKPATVISLGSPLPASSVRCGSLRTGRPPFRAEPSCSRWGLPEPASPRCSVSSYLTISPLPGKPGGMFLWHFPSGRPDRTLSCTLALRSPDFPHLPFGQARRSGELRVSTIPRPRA